MFRIIVLISVTLVVVIGAFLGFVGRGGLGEREAPGIVTSEARPEAVVRETGDAVARAADELLVSRPKQILFGDLHVHTTFSFDAFMSSLPLTGGEGAHPPADACDFARFCSALDFWSINDHAESISPTHWNDTIDSIRACNDVAGDPRNPDTVAFLGWEWTQVGRTPETHFGHKNVVVRGLGDDEIPTRPIGAGGTRRQMVEANPFGGMLAGLALHTVGDARLHDLAQYFIERAELDVCAAGVPVRDLPSDCVEMVESPDLLFEKLDDWGFDSMVIPHGTSWGFYTPPGSDWAKQLVGPMHDPDRQILMEVYSGHGNSEEWSDFDDALFADDGTPICPTPRNGYTPTCWRAGEIIAERCLAEGGSQDACAERAARARTYSAAAGPQAHLAVVGADPEEWLDAGQCPDCDQPAFNYRPRGSAQYVAALGNFDDDPEDPRRFRFGFMASSDNHYARPGTGYKENIRAGFTESRDRVTATRLVSETLAPPSEPPSAEPRAFDADDTDLVGFALMEMERQASFFLTGGLVATHADGRDRDAIWEAFERREVYGTSGPRILLWFDLLNAPDARGRPIPMGGETRMNETPIFRARAVGSFEQAPGCPDYAANALGADRLAHVCKGECYNPSPERRPITRIDVIRIRPQNAPDEPFDALIEDPWKSFECDGDPAGCSFTFSDEEYGRAGRDTVYYVRAHEAEAPGVNAQNVRCERDAEGRCTSVNLCSGAEGDLCLGEQEPRAWSSPIYVDYRGAGRS